MKYVPTFYVLSNFSSLNSKELVKEPLKIQNHYISCDSHP